MSSGNRLGLGVLYNPASKKLTPNVDLILVHGLHGGHVKTWATAAKTGKKIVWPKDLLPKKQPRTRVLSFGYMGDIYDNDTIADIRDNARSLLAHIKIRRRADPDRPIVFIAHCLGGLIVKQALCFATNEDEYISIARATHTVMFFGTPQFQKGKRGNVAAIAEAYETLASSLSATNPGRRVGGSKPSQLAKQLIRNELNLADMNEDFVHVAPDLTSIRSFYETLPLRGTNKVIIEPMDTNSYKDEEEIEMVNADHIGMCQFGKMSDATFFSVRQYIRDAVKEEERGEEGDDDNEDEDEEVEDEEDGVADETKEHGQTKTATSEAVGEDKPRAQGRRGISGLFSRRRARKGREGS